MCIRDRFKTPINAIEGYTMLLQGEELSQEQEEYVEKILFNTQRLSGLVGWQLGNMLQLFQKYRIL